MTIDCGSIIFILAILGLFFGDEGIKKFCAWVLGIMVMVWICGTIISLIMWNSMYQNFQSDPVTICEGGTLEPLPGGGFRCHFILSETQEPADLEPWTFTSHSDAVVQLKLAENQLGNDSHIIISCLGDERQWRSTIAEFTAELYKDSIFGIPAESFCPEGGSFKHDN